MNYTICHSAGCDKKRGAKGGYEGMSSDGEETKRGGSAPIVRVTITQPARPLHL